MQSPQCTNREQAKRERGMASQRDTIFLNYPAGRALQAPVGALQAIGANVEEVDEMGQVVTARRGWSMKSWGERIVVRVDTLSPDQCAVRIESRERWPLQVVDWGQNASNIDKFEHEL